MSSMSMSIMSARRWTRKHNANDFLGQHGSRLTKCPELPIALPLITSNRSLRQNRMRPPPGCTVDWCPHAWHPHLHHTRMGTMQRSSRLRSWPKRLRERCQVV